MSDNTHASDIAALIAFVAVRATDDDLRLIYDAVNARHRALRDIATATTAAALKAGDVVTLQGLSPKALNGRGGVVETVGRTGATIRLDEDSTVTLAFSRTRFAAAALAAHREGRGYLLTGVPLSTIKIGA